MSLRERYGDQEPGAREEPTGNCYLKSARFLTGPVFVLLIVTAVYVTQFKIEDRDCLPIRWNEFSLARREALLASGKTVLVLVYSEVNPESELALRHFDCKKAEKFCNGNDFEPLILRHAWAGKDIRSVWHDVGHSKSPQVVVYFPGKSPVSYHPFSP